MVMPLPWAILPAPHSAQESPGSSSSPVACPEPFVPGQKGMEGRMLWPDCLCGEDCFRGREGNTEGSFATLWGSGEGRRGCSGGHSAWDSSGCGLRGTGPGTEQEFSPGSRKQAYLTSGLHHRDQVGCGKQSGQRW